MFELEDHKNPFLTGINDDEPELIPLLSTEDEEQLNKESIPQECQYCRFAIPYFFRVW